jgi:hypothetical protein
MLRRSAALPIAFAVWSAVAVPSCESVSSEKIQTWKGTQKGPGKLQDALKSGSVDPKLRAEAALALVDIGMIDDVEQVFASMPAGERNAVTAQAIPLFAGELKTGSVEKARAARDALFTLRAHATPAEQAQIDAALLPSIESDLRAGRITGGRHSLDKMLSGMGPSAAPMIVKLLQEPAAPIPALTELLSKVGDDSTREQAGAVLVKRAAAMPEIQAQTWRALGTVGGKAVNTFLMQKVLQGSEVDAVAAAQALQVKGDADLLPFALEVASNAKANKAVRDEMFGLLEKIGPPARDGLLKIIAGDPEELVRYRAYEAALAAGKAEAIVPALEAFSEKATYKRQDVVDFLVKDIQKLGASGKGALPKALASGSALARMTAVLAYEAMGTAADAPAVAKLSGDKGTVRGFGANETVGREAARVAAALQTKAG